MILDILTVPFFVLGFALILWMVWKRRRDVLHGPYVTKSRRSCGAPCRNGAEGEGEMSNNSVRHREIACAIIIDKFGRFLIQQRDDIVGIIHPGKVGLFGGHREGEECYL